MVTHKGQYQPKNVDEEKNYNEAIKQIHINAIFTAVLHGHGCGCRCPTRVRVSDSLEFLGTRQITLGIRHGCRNPTRVRGIRLGKKIKTRVSG